MVINVEKVREQGDALSHLWYKLLLRYGGVPYEWSIKRSSTEIFALHSRLAVLYASKGVVNKLPKPPNFMFSTKRDIATVQNYLQQLCKLRHTTKAKQILCYFFGCSANSFLPGFGPKPKEGWIEKVSGGRVEDESKNWVIRFLRSLARKYNRKWLLIGDSFLAYYHDNSDSSPEEVLLCDPYFDVSYKHMLGKYGITVDNSYRKLFFTCAKKHLDEYHDEIARLMIDSQWCIANRFGSFAPEREMINAQFYIDAQGYFSDVASAIEKAESTIYITGWWLTPELYLRRPASEFPDTRLDKMLYRKACEGIKIYIVIFKEVYGSLTINSFYSKGMLKRLHKNIMVVRHPDHLAAGVIKWAHHEKMVILDQKTAFIGGIDLCFGRYDNPEHRLLDPESAWWQGKDYSNPLVKDFYDLHLPDKDSIDRKVHPRMPWHDIALRVEGQAARDVARHFIGRWNTCKVNKDSKKQSKIPFLVPRAKFFDPKEAPVDTSHVSASAFVRDIPTVGTHSVQILRSASRWSSGIFTESSILSAYIGLIEEARHYIYIENQFFVTNSTTGSGMVSNKIGLALFNRIKTAYDKGERFHVYVMLPLKPAFEGEIDQPEAFALRKVMEFQYRSISRDRGQSLLERLEADGIPASQYITFNGLRVFGDLGESMVTEMVYIHSKLMIVDDRVAIVGSANLNDRSMLGNRDSEVAAVITDSDRVPTRMNGAPFEASRLVFELRCRLFEEHLGIQEAHRHTELEAHHPHQVVEDPLAEAFIQGPWSSTSTNNTQLYREAFHCFPDDTVRNFTEYAKVTKIPLPSYEEQVRLMTKVKGNLVDFPVNFLCEENLGEGSIVSTQALIPSDIFL